MIHSGELHELSKFNGTKFVGLANAIAVGELDSATIDPPYNIWRIRGSLLSPEGKHIAEGRCFVRNSEVDWIFVATENQCLET